MNDIELGEYLKNKVKYHNDEHITEIFNEITLKGCLTEEMIEEYLNKETS